MLTFPRLRTGAVVQYPFERAIEQPVSVFTFLDGKEQRFPSRRCRRKWVVRLDQMDEQEAAAVDSLVRAHLLTLEPFQFTDPWSGTIHDRCRIATERHETGSIGVANRAIYLVIVEEE